MADRYWVGGTGNWDTSTTTHWSDVSNGVGGKSVPSVSDNVFFDNYSGIGTVTVVYSGTKYCKNLTFTGYTGTFTNVAAINVYGDVTLDSGVTYTSGGSFQFRKASGTQYYTSNGVTFITELELYEAATTLKLFDDVIAQIIYIQVGTFDSDNKNLTLKDFTGSGTFTLHSSLIILTDPDCTIDVSGATFTANTATFKLTGSVATNWKTCNFGSNSIYNFWIATSGVDNVHINGSTPSFNQIKVDNSSAILSFADTISVTVTDFIGGGCTLLAGTGSPTYFNFNAYGDGSIVHNDYPAFQVNPINATSLAFTGFTVSNFAIRDPFSLSIMWADWNIGQVLNFDDNNYGSDWTYDSGTCIFTYVGGESVDFTTLNQTDVSFGGNFAVTYGGSFFITKAGGGIIEQSFNTITGSYAVPDNTWYAPGATDGGGNSGWIFGPAPIPIIMNPVNNNFIIVL